MSGNRKDYSERILRPISETGSLYDSLWSGDRRFYERRTPLRATLRDCVGLTLAECFCIMACTRQGRYVL